MTAPPPTFREYDVAAESTAAFGRVLCSARTHHFIVDGPIQNGCPGEELTPAEVFLSGIASCGVELMQVIAREEGIPLRGAAITIHGVVDRAAQARSDVTLFTSVRVDCVLQGTDAARAGGLIAGFTRRCPLYGTLSVATPGLVIEYRVVE